MTARPVLVADIGKSTTRLARAHDGIAGDAVTASGIAGLATPGGAADAMSRLQDCADRLDEVSSDRAPVAIAVGVAGALTAPDAAAELARELAARWGMPACVTSDVVTAHLGALGGAPGTILVAGTGAVAWSLSAEGEARLADGLGPDLGDRGSGYWIGRAAMTAGLAPTGSSGTPLSVAGIAAFARVVLDAAEGGDPAAVDIVTRAVDELVATACSASSPGDSVACLGGLTQHAFFAHRLHAGLRAAGRRPQPPAASALDGAALIADSAGLPHERLLHRAL